ncbi:MAG TPA: ATP-dependent Clp protease proteolytic subunit [Cryptosporangiaceae bacterium]|nr:ATP-dependent Clp protease proteolytic subunit [Cryptosporangiaceae bacterium]
MTPYPDGGGSWWEERLFEQRILLATGRLDAERATALAAKLLTLDATGDGPISLRIDTGNAELGAAWLLVDTLDALVTPVHALVVGEVGGGSLALLTAVTERRSHPHARFRLADPPLSGIAGTAEQISGEFASQQGLLDAFHARLAATTGQDLSEITADLRRGRFLTADEAVRYGLVTALLG